MKRWALRAAKLASIGIVVVYLTAYVSLSRSGRAEAIRCNSESLYYFTPENSDGWRFRERACTLLFWPLNQVDSWINPEMRHANSEPLMDFS